MKPTRVLLTCLAAVSIILLNTNFRPEPVIKPIVTDDCSKLKGMDRILCLTETFKATLTPEQLKTVQLDYTQSNAAQWSNFPATFGNAHRLGLRFGNMKPEQIAAAKALIKFVSGTSANEGFDELQQLMNADDLLATRDTHGDYGAGNYYIAFLGTPSATGKFEIQFGGHHMAFANTYNKGVLAGATPSFRGVEPFGKFTQNGMSNQPMDQEQTALAAILASLSEADQAKARLERTFDDLLVGPQRDGQFPATPSGIKCSTLSSAQKKLVLAAIDTYVDDIDEADEMLYMKKYTKELDDTYLSYSGSKTMIARNDYMRLDGPSLWIEYSSQGGIVMQGTHPHSVWRDKIADYGGK